MTSASYPDPVVWTPLSPGPPPPPPVRAALAGPRADAPGMLVVAVLGWVAVLPAAAVTLVFALVFVAFGLTYAGDPEVGTQGIGVVVGAALVACGVLGWLVFHARVALRAVRDRRWAPIVALSLPGALVGLPAALLWTL